MIVNFFMVQATGKSTQRGRLTTVDVLVPTSLDNILTHLLRYKEVGLVEKKQLVFSSFLFIVSFHKKSMFAELHLEINCPKSSLIHLAGQPYCKRKDQQKAKMEK
jgi:hypothetical protein